MITLTSGGAGAGGDAFPLLQASSSSVNDKKSSGAEGMQPCVALRSIIPAVALAGQSITAATAHIVPALTSTPAKRRTGDHRSNGSN